MNNSLKNRSFLKYFKNTTWLAGGHMLRLSLGMLVSVAVARHLGPEDFGLYNYALSIVFLIGVVCELGLKNLSRRELVKTPEHKEEILGTCLILSVSIALIAFSGLLLFTVLAIRDTSTSGLLLVLGGSLLLIPFNGIETWFQSQTRGDLSVIPSTTSVVVFALVKIIAIFMEAPLLVFGYIYLAELTTVISLGALLYARHYGSMLQWSWNLQWARFLISKSWPLLLSGIAITIYMRVDQIMLGVMLGNEEVGQYAAATRLSTVFYFIPQLLAVSLFPAIIRSRDLSKDVYRNRVQKYFDLNSGLAYLIVIPGTVLAPWIVNVLYGDQYLDSRVIFSIHVWACLFVFTGVARAQFLLAEDFLKFSLICTAAGAAINVILNFLLIPVYSGMGAALATVAAQFLSSFASSFVYKRSVLFGMAQLKSLFLFFRWGSLKNLLTI